MGKQKQRKRTRCKIDDLPEELQNKVIEMISDTKNTYTDIAFYLYDKGYEISRSSVGRYALRTNSALERLQEAQQQTKVLIEAVKANPDADYTEAGLQIMGSELTKKLANANEEWDDMPLDKAARVMVQLSRTQVYKEKLKQDMKSKLGGALEAFKQEVYAELENTEPELYQRIVEVANRTYNKIMNEDS